MATYNVFQRRLTNWFNKLSAADRATARSLGFRGQGKSQVYKSYLILLQLTQPSLYDELHALMGKYREEPDFKPKLAIRRQIIDLINTLPYLDYDDTCKLWDKL
jgi:hypothetical protein